MDERQIAEALRNFSGLLSTAPSKAKELAQGLLSYADSNRQQARNAFNAQGITLVGKPVTSYDVDTAMQGASFAPIGIGMIRPIFHSTTPSAASSIEKNGFDLSKSADGSVWFTADPLANEVAATGKGAIVKRYLDDKKMKLGGWEEADKYLTDQLISKGYDGLKLDDWYQIFNPDKLGK